MIRAWCARAQSEKPSATLASAGHHGAMARPTDRLEEDAALVFSIHQLVIAAVSSVRAMGLLLVKKKLRCTQRCDQRDGGSGHNGSKPATMERKQVGRFTVYEGRKQRQERKRQATDRTDETKAWPTCIRWPCAPARQGFRRHSGESHPQQVRFPAGQGRTASSLDATCRAGGGWKVERPSAELALFPLLF